MQTKYAVDIAAKDQALRRFNLPECLHIPIAAVDEAAIRKYIGEVVQQLGRRSPPGAFLVRAQAPPGKLDDLPIWAIQKSEVFHRREQLWVHIHYTRYRQAYQKAFPNEDISGQVLSHCMNRRVAAIKGFQYVRVTPTSRGANSSSAFSENWGVALYRKPDELRTFKRRGLAIQYADLSDLMLMLDLQLGGGVMDTVNTGQKLIRSSS